MTKEEKIKNKEKLEKILNYLGWTKIQAHVWDYDPRCGIDRDFVETVWVNEKSKLYYRINETLPFVYNYNEETDEFEFSIYRENDKIEKSEVLTWITNRILKDGNNITMSKGVVVITDLKQTKVFVANGFDDYNINLFNAAYDYVTSNLEKKVEL
jgi:hypothetical protein